MRLPYNLGKVILGENIIKLPTELFGDVMS